MEKYLVIQKAWQHPTDIHKICYSGDVVELEGKDAKLPLFEGRIKIHEEKKDESIFEKVVSTTDKVVNTFNKHKKKRR